MLAQPKTFFYKVARELIILAWILGAGTWLFSVIEMIAVLSFSKFFFRLGIPVYRKTLDIGTGNLQFESGQTINRAEGKFRFTASDQVFFRSRMFWFKLFRLNTPFPYKATGTIRPGNKMDIIARVPLGTSLFFLFWVTGWLAGTLVLIIASGHYSMLPFGLIGLAFAGAMVLISYPIEKGRMDTMVEELQSIITEQNKRFAS